MAGDVGLELMLWDAPAGKETLVFSTCLPRRLVAASLLLREMLGPLVLVNALLRVAFVTDVVVPFWT